jgi:hypothetical protein
MKERQEKKKREKKLTPKKEQNLQMLEEAAIMCVQTPYGPGII